MQGADFRFIPACAGNSSSSRIGAVREPVHPRVCGELPGCSGTFSDHGGSSPRVRGTRPPSPSTRWPPAVHPRVCGELAADVVVDRAGVQVHPRVCGELPRRRLPLLPGARFIPACAGNSRRPLPAPAPSPVHPRVCGELRAPTRRATWPSGSSPRVRGTPRQAQLVRLCRRFIPACAGNSLPTRSATNRCSVHPRVCGELATVNVCVVAVVGSSPRVRGTHLGELRADVDDRFIPACAGNSFESRVGAEVVAGSSPRVRGTRVRRRRRRERRRFIPACAGNSRSSPRRCVPSAVHPRVCGELVAGDPADVPAAGSSPRVRGTRRRFRKRTLRSSVHPRVCGELVAWDGAQVYRCGSSPRVRGTPGAVP